MKKDVMEERSPYFRELMANMVDSGKVRTAPHMVIASKNFTS